MKDEQVEAAVECVRNTIGRVENRLPRLRRNRRIQRFGLLGTAPEAEEMP